MLKMRISNRFGIKSVQMGGVYYFPQEPTEVSERNGKLKANVTAVFNDGKLRQDIMYIEPNIYIKLLQYWLK